MSAQLGVTIKGLKELNKKLGNAKKLRNPVEKYLDRASVTLKNFVRIYSPVRSGAMRGSWESKIKATKYDAVARVFNVATNKGVHYAVPLEFGVNLTPSSSDPRIQIPFLAPAYEKMREQLGKLNSKLDKDIIREYKKP